MEELLKEYAHLIKSYQIVQDETMSMGKKIWKAYIYFHNETKLSAFTSALKGKERYGYQWMKLDNTMIVCWDNADHNPEIETHPDHKHVGDRKNVEPSEKMDLRKVLEYIAKILGVLLLIGFMGFWIW